MYYRILIITESLIKDNGNNILYLFCYVIEACPYSNRLSTFSNIEPGSWKKNGTIFTLPIGTGRVEQTVYTQIRSTEYGIGSESTQFAIHPAVFRHINHSGSQMNSQIVKTRKKLTKLPVPATLGKYDRRFSFPLGQIQYKSIMIYVI